MGSSASWASFLLILTLYAGCCPATTWAACLQAPANITRLRHPETGEDFVLQIAHGNWDSATLTSTIATILIREGLGLAAELAGPYESSAHTVQAVVGCTTFACDEVKPVPDAHMEFENWYSEAAVRALRTHPQQVRQDFVGYDGQEGVYMKREVVDSIWSTHQLPIEFYKAWEHDQTPWRRLFSRPRDITIPADEGCRFEAAEDLAAHGFNCSSDGWWYSPACRNNTDLCAPVLLGSHKWLGKEVCSVAQSHNLPFALTFVTFPNRNILEGSISAMFYWWRPDWTYKGIGPVNRLIFKKHNRKEWESGVFTSDFPDFELKKTMWTGIDRISEVAAEFFDSFTLSRDNMDDLMAQLYNRTQSGESDAKAVLACEWVRNNERVWRSWIPENVCEDGKGKERNGPIQECRPCELGRYGEGGRCHLCSAGRFSNQAGSTRCKDCDAGHFANSSGRTACDQCPPGTSTEGQRGLAICADCPVGKFSKGAAECNFCNRSSYANVTGTAECLACSGDETTAEIASHSEAACRCPQGTYKAQGTLAGVCSPCPPGMTCPFGSDASHFPGGDASGQGPCPQVRPGFWSPPEDPTSIFVCGSEAHCPGGPPSSCSSRLEGQACTTCQAEYTMSGGMTNATCISCTSEQASIIFYAFIPFIVGPLVVVLLYALGGKGIESWDKWRNLFPCLAFIGLDFGQTVDLLQAGNVIIPGALRPILPGQSSSERIFKFFRPECIGVSGFESSFTLKGAGPIFVLLIILYTKFLSMILSRITKKPALDMERNRVFNVFMSMMFTFFSAVAALSLVLFKCVQNPNEKRTLAADLSIVCWDSGAWQKMAVLGAFCVLIYCFGFGSLFAKTIIQAPFHDNFADRGYQNRWKFLFHKFRPTVWWWALVYLQKNFLLNLGFVIFMSGISQLYWATSVVLLYTAASVICQPYRARFANILELTACLCLAYTISLLLWFTERGSEESPDSTMDELLLVVILVPFSVALLIVFSTLRRHATVRTGGELLVQQEHLAFVQTLGCYIDLCQAEPGKGFEFFRTLGEWDRWYMMQVCNTVSFELLGQRLSGQTRLVDKTSARQEMMGHLFTDH